MSQKLEKTDTTKPTSNEIKKDRPANLQQPDISGSSKPPTSTSYRMGVEDCIRVINRLPWEMLGSAKRHLEHKVVVEALEKLITNSKSEE